MSEAYEAARIVAGDEAEFRDDVIVPGNPPVMKPEASNEEVAKDPMFDKLAADLGAMTGQDEPEKPKDEPEAKAKGDEAEEDDVSPGEWDDLSNERPWTPERHAKVRAQHKQDRQKVGAMLTMLNKREAKFKGKLQQFRTEKQQMDLITTRVMNDLETMRSGSPDQAMAALGRLAQRDPHQMYESMSLAMLGKAPQAQKDAATRALEEKIAKLEEKLAAKEQADTESTTQAEARGRAIEVLQSAEEWPLLAERAAAAPQQTAGEFWQLYMQASRQAGRYLDVDSFADRIERKLRLQTKPSRQVNQNGAAGSGPDREQEARAQAKPEPAQSTPRSLSPSHAASSGAARRVVTEDELKDELIRNGPPEFFQQFGF